jgi:hypothetical protein
LAPPWAEALSAETSLDLGSTKSPVAEIVADIERAYPDTPILYGQNLASMILPAAQGGTRLARDTSLMRKSDARCSKLNFCTTRSGRFHTFPARSKGRSGTTTAGRGRSEAEWPEIVANGRKARPRGSPRKGEVRTQEPPLHCRCGMRFTAQRGKFQVVNWRPCSRLGLAKPAVSATNSVPILLSQGKLQWQKIRVTVWWLNQQ